MIKKIFIIISTCFIAISLIILFIGPICINQNWFKSVVENKISQRIKAEFKIGKIHFSWFEGVCLHSITFYPDAISNKPFIDIEKIDVSIRFFTLFELKPYVKINLQDIQINFVRFSDNTNNLSNWLESFNKNQKEKSLDHTPKKQNNPFHLPFDVKLDFFIAGLTIDYQDYFLNKNIAIKNTHLKLISNSILKSAISINIQSNIDIDHREHLPLKLGMRLSNLLNTNKSIHIDDGFLFIAQNSSIKWKGALNNNFSIADFEISPIVLDCAELYPKVQIFLPENFLFDVHDMPVIEINRMLWTKNLSKNKNQLKLIKIKVKSDQFSYSKDNNQLFAQKIAINIQEAMMNQTTDSLMDFNIKELSVNIPNIEISHEKVGRIKKSLLLKANIDRMCINKKDLKSTRVSGTNASIQIGKTLALIAEDLDIQNKHIAFAGNVTIDLEEISSRLPLFRKKNDIKMKGQTAIAWNVQGCLPKKNEIENIPILKDLNMKKHLPFLEKAAIKLDLNNAVFEFEPDSESRYILGPMSTDQPLCYQYSNKQGKGNIATRLVLKNLDKTFKINMNKPLDVEIDITASHKDFKKIHLSQKILFKTLGLNYSLIADISGFHRFIGKDMQSKIPFWFDYFGGSIKNNLAINDLSRLKPIIPGVALKGNLTIANTINLIPKKSINIKMLSKSDGIDFNLDQKMDIKQFKTSLDLEKTFHIINSNEDLISKKSKQNKYLSSTVMKTSSNNNYLIQTQHPVNSRFAGHFQTHTRMPAFSFRSLKLKTGPMPVEINNATIYFYMNKGLPYLERIQFELFDGTVIASARLIKKEDYNYVRFQTSFSGIDFNRVFKKNYRELGADSEINGQLLTIFPISFQLKEILSSLDFRLRFNHIGRMALERLLYSFDPYENNEIIISQRKLLKTGTPIWIDLIVKDGNISLTGELSVGGIATIDLPPLKRFAITGISGLESIENKLIRFRSVFNSRLINILN